MTNPTDIAQLAASIKNWFGPNAHSISATTFEKDGEVIFKIGDSGPDEIIRQLVQELQQKDADIEGLRNSGDKVVEYWAEQSLQRTQALRALEV